MRKEIHYTSCVFMLASRVDYVKPDVRLVYVGITRLKKELIVTWNTRRKGDATPSLALSALMGWWEGMKQ
jgi:superfamily I DNA/RNA helicase